MIIMLKNGLPNEKKFKKLKIGQNQVGPIVGTKVCLNRFWTWSWTKFLGLNVGHTRKRTKKWATPHNHAKTNENKNFDDEHDIIPINKPRMVKNDKLTLVNLCKNDEVFNLFLMPQGK